jgi:magnesium-transporting ATPase (P-type)
MAANAGFSKFVSRDSNTVTIEVNGTEEKYEILKVNEFSSDRKRMSVIAKRQSDNKVYSFVKGADVVIIDRLTSTSKGANATAFKTMNDEASKGKRTLMFAYKDLG